MSNFILQDLIRTWVRVLSGESGMSKNAQIQCIFWKCEQHKFEKNFPTHTVKYASQKENSTSILERDKALISLQEYERMYP